MQNIRIASPCSARWEEMAGDHRRRYCSQCGLHVYNFSAMAPSEIQQIVAARTGRLCARFYQRADGTMLTENCPKGSLVSASRPSVFTTAALTALVGIASANAGPLAAAQNVAATQEQSTANAFSLVVSDPIGARIANADVSLVNHQTGEHFDLKAGADGQLSMSTLPAGSYDLVVTAPGFASFVEKNVAVPGHLAVTLQIGALMGEVVVVSEEDLSSSEIPANLIEPSALQTLAAPKPADHRNAVSRFFSRLHRLFQ